MAEILTKLLLNHNDYRSIKDVEKVITFTLPETMWKTFAENNSIKTILEEDIAECADYLPGKFETTTDYHFMLSLSDAWNNAAYNRKRTVKESKLKGIPEGAVRAAGVNGWVGARGWIGARPNESPQTYLIKAITMTCCRKILKHFLRCKILDSVLLETIFNQECTNKDFLAYYKKHSKN